LAFRTEHGRDRIAATLANDDNHLALAVLVAGKAAINAVLFEVRGLDVAAEIAAVHLCLTLAADNAALQFVRHGFPQFVQEHERALVRDAQVAGQRERGLALYLIAENGDGCEIAAARKLGAGEQCPGRDVAKGRSLGQLPFRPPN
jgi:hypothetical protein